MCVLHQTSNRSFSSTTITHVDMIYVGTIYIWYKDVGCRSNFDPSRPLYTQDTSFSVKSSLTAVCQGVQTLSTDIFVWYRSRRSRRNIRTRKYHHKTSHLTQKRVRVCLFSHWTSNRSLYSSTTIICTNQNENVKSVFEYSYYYVCQRSVCSRLMW